MTGRVRHTLASREAFPAVGDWIALKPAGPAEEMGRIVDVLPRRGQFVRKAAGTATEAQVVAANVDVVFLVSGLDHDFNVRASSATCWPPSRAAPRPSSSSTRPTSRATSRRHAWNSAPLRDGCRWSW